MTTRDGVTSNILSRPPTYDRRSITYIAHQKILEVLYEHCLDYPKMFDWLVVYLRMLESLICYEDYLKTFVPYT